ncbi:hypothetical protein LPJ53_005451 [Coemansia erecta]|uniref:WW domain-containing protein n=1 Tax=Coemansia erecta TaxID=147472 RepID=A0A9W8CN61_9FUNG|nr:hypothetical protein LPJ53_005451 [Coemansia erecta]
MTQQQFQGGKPAPPQLPPGYVAEWDSRYNRYYFVNLSTKASQWELPSAGPGGAGPDARSPGPSMYGSPQPRANQHQSPPPYQAQPQQYGQRPPPQHHTTKYYAQPPPQPYYQQPPPQQYHPQYSSQPQTIVVQEQPQKKQSFFSKHPVASALVAGGVGAFAVNEISEHFEEREEEAREEGYEAGYDAGYDDGGDYDGDY